MRSLRAATGLQVTLFASEPEVRQPIFANLNRHGGKTNVQYSQWSAGDTPTPSVPG
jgi:hypothetical protein